MKQYSIVPRTFWWPLVLLALWAGGCSRPTVSLPYAQTFDGPQLGSEWHSAGGGWKIIDGRLHNDGARNVPL